MKIAVCIPCGDLLHSRFMIRVCALQRWHREHFPEDCLDIRIAAGTLIETSRNTLANNALAEGADAILWLDSDMVFPPSLLARLLAHNKEIVAANYSTRRQEDIGTVAFDRSTTDGWVNSFGKAGLQKINSIGMGAMLVRMDVLRKMPKPWFIIGYNPSNDFYVGEDIYFCNKATQLGVDVWVDHDLSQETGHLGLFEYTMEIVGAAHGTKEGWEIAYGDQRPPPEAPEMSLEQI